MGYAIDSDTTLDNVTPIAIADGANLDAFSRLRVSTPESIFNSTFQYDLAPLRYNAITANSGTITHLPNESSAQLATAASAGSSAALQSKAYNRYLPAKSQLISITQTFGAATSGITKRAGYFEANDGIFIEQNGTTDIAFVKRTSTSGSPVDNRVTQANWNLDKLDGTGNSRLTLDLTKSQIFIIDLQWLGLGRVRVGFDIGGTIVYAHQFIHANIVTLPYMKTANLPIRWEIAGNGIASMKATCAAVISEGGVEKDEGFLMSAGTGATARTFTAGTPLPIVAIRPATTFNGIANRIQLVLESWAFIPTSGTAEFFWQVLYNPTITGGAWTAVNANSCAEVNVTGTAVTGGIPIAGGHTLSTTANRLYEQVGITSHKYPWCYDGAGNQIVIAFVATEVAGSSDIHLDMQWRELR
jgi:hypothetical protein